MTRIEIKRSKTTMIVTMVGGLIVTALALFVFDELGRWCLAPVGTVLLIAGVLGYRDNMPRIVITETGICVRGMTKGEILWQQIRSVRNETIPRGGNLVVLELHDGKAHRFNVDGMGAQGTSIVQIIRSHLPQNSSYN